MSTEALVNQVIQSAIERAHQSASDARDFANQAMTAASGAIFTGQIREPAEPKVKLPAFKPDEDLTGLFKKTFDDALAEFGPDFDKHLRDFLDRFFPTFDQCLMNTVDPWICQTIQSGGVGLPVAVEQAIYHRAREREVQASSSQMAEAVEGFAARGWELPAGVLVDSVARIQQDLTDKSATHARDVAIEQAKQHIEMLKFAVDQGTRLRLGVLGAVIDYLRAYLETIDLAIKEAAALVDAKLKLWQTTAAYYHALVAVGELSLKWGEIVNHSDLRLATLTVEAFNQRIKNQTEAAVSAAKAMGDIAAAAYGAQNTVADISHQSLESL